MKSIIRVYQIVDGKEQCTQDPDQILKIVSSAKEDIDLDWIQGKQCKISSSRELIGETVKIGDTQIEIHEH